jgi:hypothetical protein
MTSSPCVRPGRRPRARSRRGGNDYVGKPFDAAELRTRVEQHQGTSSNRVLDFGLGLAIAKRVVDHHRGTIAIESSAGDGTTVTIRLPAAVPAARPTRTGPTGMALASPGRSWRDHGDES